MKYFPDLCNVFRRFVPSFATFAPLLDDKLQKYQPFSFVLDEKELDSSKSIQQKLSTPPALALPYKEVRMTIDTNAGYLQVVCVLRTGSDERTDINDNVPGCNSKNAQVTAGKDTLYAICTFCTECDVDKKLIIVKHAKDLIEMEEPGVSTVQRTAP